ncbi:anchored repeat-type ABC transporter permease subunit [Canibacter sp. lx-72]|uniref:anchored repeat-type ABC transporter permease subunit n=1 Tax=Canibacter zhuwentaonis TaxID=2837491 RepID=UPI001BDD8D39|nr:anchored repeat-type ABC transporter permease subunit [Canibacter zhuwentaonis]
MPSIIDFIADLTNSDLQFLARALAVAVASSIVCAVLGCYVVLRGMAFIGDAVAHAVFPGLAIAFVLQANLLISGALAGIVTAALVALFSQHPRLKNDTVIGVLFSFAFGLGVVIISFAPGYAGSLQQFLFGSITSVTLSDVITVAAIALALLLLLALIHRPLVLATLDRELALAAGVRVGTIEIILHVAVAVAVVISVQAIGNVLVLALLITPAATARLLTSKFGVMMTIAPVLGIFAAVTGMYFSWGYGLPAGGSIVLVATAMFFIAFLLAPKHGVLRAAVARRKNLNPGVKKSCTAVVAGAAAVCVFAIATVGGALSAAPVAAQTREDEIRVIGSVHADAVSAYVDKGKLVLAGAADVDIDGDGVIDRGSRLDPGKTVFHLASQAKQELPDDADFEFLGKPGENVWLAPQQQDQSLIWLGFNTEDESVVTAVGEGAIAVKLKSVKGPGALEIFQHGITGPDRLFSSVTELVSWQMHAPQHAHANWAFTKEGVYYLTFEMSAKIKGEQQSASASYVFVVGELPDNLADLFVADGAPKPDNGGDESGVDPVVPNVDHANHDTSPAQPDPLPEKPADEQPQVSAPSPVQPQPTAPDAQSQLPSAAATEVCSPSSDFTRGHIDLFNVTAVGRVATLQLKEDVTGRHILREPEGVVVSVGEHARTSIPAGSPGAGSGYVLPVTQRHDLPWPGWDTNDTRGSSYTDVKISIESVRGPGSVHLFTQNSFGGVRSLLTHGGTGLPGVIHEPRPAHTHAQWVFTHQGVYQLRASAQLTDLSTGATIHTATRTYTFRVGDVSLADALCGIDGSAGTADSRRVANEIPVYNETAQQVKSGAQAKKNSVAKKAAAVQLGAKAAEALKKQGISPEEFAQLSPAEQQAILDRLNVQTGITTWQAAGLGALGMLIIGGIVYGTAQILKRYRV